MTGIVWAALTGRKKRPDGKTEVLSASGRGLAAATTTVALHLAFLLFLATGNKWAFLGVAPSLNLGILLAFGLGLTGILGERK